MKLGTAKEVVRNLPQPIQMELSKKQRTFPELIIFSHHYEKILSYLNFIITIFSYYWNELENASLSDM